MFISMILHHHFVIFILLLLPPLFLLLFCRSSKIGFISAEHLYERGILLFTRESRNAYAQFIFQTSAEMLRVEFLRLTISPQVKKSGLVSRCWIFFPPPNSLSTLTGFRVRVKAGVRDAAFSFQVLARMGSCGDPAEFLSKRFLHDPVPLTEDLVEILPVGGPLGACRCHVLDTLLLVRKFFFWEALGR